MTCHVALFPLFLDNALTPQADISSLKISSSVLLSKLSFCNYLDAPSHAVRYQLGYVVWAGLVHHGSVGVLFILHID